MRSIADEEVAAARRGNFAARARMAVLYDQSVPWRGLVIGTGNKTEALLGYSTIYGDNAYALNPIGDLYKSQVRQLAEEMGVPQRVLCKPPTADLWPGQTDEGELGLSYEQMDRLLYWMVDRRLTQGQLEQAGFAPDDDRARAADDRGVRVQAPDAAGGQADHANPGRRLPLPASAAGA